MNSPKAAPRIGGSPNIPNFCFKVVGVRVVRLKPSRFQSGSSKIAGIV